MAYTHLSLPMIRVLVNLGGGRLLRFEAPGGYRWFLPASHLALPVTGPRQATVRALLKRDMLLENTDLHGQRFDLTDKARLYLKAKRPVIRL